MKYIFLLATVLIGEFSYSQDLKTIYYHDGNQRFSGLITDTAKKTSSGVLILPAWKGIDNEARTAALNLQNEGYLAFIADIYGEGNVPKTNEEAAKKSGYYKQNHEVYQNRINLALEQLRKQGVEKIAVIGYCFGGTGALEVARASFDVEGVVSIHGSLGKDVNRNNTGGFKCLMQHLVL